MPKYRYDGPSHVFKTSEEDKGTARGAIGTFSKEMVDRYSNPKQGQIQHRFTSESELKAGEVEEAKEVAALPLAGSTGGVDETRSVAASKS